MSLPFQIPTVPRDVARQSWLAQIARDPTQATYRGLSLTVRIAETSAKRRAEVAGYSPDLAELDCMLALPDGEDEPEALKTPIEFRRPGAAVDERWRIVEVQSHPGAGCYRLTLTRANR